MNYEEINAAYERELDTPEARQILSDGETGAAPAISPSAPSFRAEWLPRPLAAMCTALADNLSVPVDLPAVIGLGVASACGCGRIRVIIRPDWEEPCQLFLLAAMDSGSAKSPVFAAMTRILTRMQAEENQRRAVQIKQDAAEVEVLQARKAEAVKKKQVEQARQLAEQIARFHAVHPMRRFISSNTTPETYPEVLAENDGATAILDDEGDLFDLLAGRYQDAPSLDPFLKGYSGSPLESHRRGRLSVTVPQANLSVLILAQPFVVDEVFHSPRMVGKGLLPRFLIAWPEPLREYGPEPPIPAQVKEAYEAAVARMMDTGRHCYYLSPEAQRLFMEFRDEVRQKQFDELGGLRRYGFTGKIVGNAARVACALKLWSGRNDDEITARQMTDAIAITRYFIGHILYRLGPAARLSEKARWMLDWLRERGQGSLSERNIKQALRKRNGFKTGNAVEESLQELAENHFIRRCEDQTGGRPSKQVYLAEGLL